MPSSTSAAPLWSMLVPSGLIGLFVFSEAVGDQFPELQHGFGRVIAGCLNLELGTFGAAQEQHAHHAFGVGSLTCAADQNIARVLRSELHEFGRGASMQPELISHLERSTRTIHGFLTPSELAGAVW